MVVGGGHSRRTVEDSHFPPHPGGGGCLSSIKCGGDGIYRKGAEKKPGLEAEDAAVSVAYWRLSLAL